MKKKLLNRQVIIRTSDDVTLTGTVLETDDVGVWVAIATNAKPLGVPPTCQFPVMFAPFSQLVWLVTSLSPAERSAEPPH